MPKEQKDVVLALIDLKTESEMEKALTRFEAAVNGLKADMDAKFSAIDSKFTSQFSFLKWIIGSLGALIVCLGVLITI